VIALEVQPLNVLIVVGVTMSHAYPFHCHVLEP
jgi:hypothetical protein